MLFDGWADLWRVGAAGVAGYVAMVLELRVAGKRTLAKMNAFDLVVTVALGSVLATIALSRDVSLTEGVAAITVLVGAQWAVAWTSVRMPAARRLTRAEPTVVFRSGEFDEVALRDTRVLREEVEQSMRSSGFGDYERVAAVVLETDGTLSVVAVDQCHTATALPTLPRADARRSPS